MSCSLNCQQSMRPGNRMTVLSTPSISWYTYWACTLALVALSCGCRHLSGEQAFAPAPAQAALAPSEVTPHAHSALHGDNGGPAGARSLPSGNLQADCFRESDTYPKVFQSTYGYYTPADLTIMTAQIRMANQAMALSCSSSGGCWQTTGPDGAGWCNYMCGYGRRLSEAFAPGSAGGAQASIAAAPAPSPSAALLCPSNITPVNATEHTKLCECRGYRKAWQAGPQPLTEHQKAVLRDCATFNTDVKQRFNVTTVELGSCADVTIHLHND